jgi:hypothetical protein
MTLVLLGLAASSAGAMTIPAEHSRLHSVVYVSVGLFGMLGLLHLFAALYHEIMRASHERVGGCNCGRARRL